jgi:hypothetical protein
MYYKPNREALTEEMPAYTPPCAIRMKDISSGAADCNTMGSGDGSICRDAGSQDGGSCYHGGSAGACADGQGAGLK